MEQKRRNIHVNDYKGPKVYDYLQPGQKNLIAFGHGWGDTLMFLKIYEEIKKKWSAIEWELYVESGQEKVIRSAKHWSEGDYDFIFHIHYPMGEGSGNTKNATCCREEIGMEPVEGIFKINKRYVSPFVAVHFQGTALPDAVNCPQDKVQIIWESIVELGMIPIEAHFVHMYHNPINKKYSFIDCTVRGVKARLQNLISLIQHSYAFIGVGSGPLVTALSIMPKKTLMIESQYKLSDYIPAKESTTNYIHHKDITKEKITGWLRSLSKQ
jgi:hypothetical protein